jgi:hypothetical protein
MECCAVRLERPSQSAHSILRAEERLQALQPETHPECKHSALAQSQAFHGHISHGFGLLRVCRRGTLHLAALPVPGPRRYEGRGGALALGVG